MTTSRTYSEHEGTFKPWEQSDRPCRRCKATAVRCRLWESSCGGYEDWKYECLICGYVWWVDGIDS